MVVIRRCCCYTHGFALASAHVLGHDDGRHTRGCRSSCRSWIPTGGDGPALYHDGGAEDDDTDKGENNGPWDGAGSSPESDENPEPSEIGISEGRIGRTERPKNLEEESWQAGPQ